MVICTQVLYFCLKNCADILLLFEPDSFLPFSNIRNTYFSNVYAGTVQCTTLSTVQGVLGLMHPYQIVFQNMPYLKDLFSGPVCSTKSFSPVPGHTTFIPNNLRSMVCRLYKPIINLENLTKYFLGKKESNQMRSDFQPLLSLVLLGKCSEWFLVLACLEPSLSNFPMLCWLSSSELSDRVASTVGNTLSTLYYHYGLSGVAPASSRHQ